MCSNCDRQYTKYFISYIIIILNVLTDVIIQYIRLQMLKNSVLGWGVQLIVVLRWSPFLGTLVMENLLH